jgi:hypothetical protein
MSARRSPARLVALPPGVHPGDASTADHFNPPVPAISADVLYSRPSAPPWATSNPHALPVFQRLGRDAAAGFAVVTTASTESSVAKVAQYRPGRTRLTIWVPSSYFPGGGAAVLTPAGVVVAEDPGKAQQGMGAPLFIGDAMDWSSESSVWAAVQPGQTIGVVAWLHCWDTAVRRSQI